MRADVFQYRDVTLHFSYSYSSKTRQQLLTDSTLEPSFFAA